MSTPETPDDTTDYGALPVTIADLLDDREALQRQCRTLETNNDHLSVRINQVTERCDDVVGKLSAATIALRQAVSKLAARANLADAAGELYRAMFLHEERPKPYDTIACDFMSEAHAYLVEIGELPPDPGDDPSLAERLGK